jgi:hypothetical protein
LTRGQHDYGTSRLVDSEWTGSPPNGEPRIRATRGTNTGLRLGRDLPPRGSAHPGPYPVTPAPVATPAQMPPATTRPLRARDPASECFHLRAARATSAGPKHLIYLGPHRASCEPLITSQTGTPLIRVFKFASNTTVSGSLFLSLYIGTSENFLSALQTLHCLAPCGHLLLYFDPCSFAT